MVSWSEGRVSLTRAEADVVAAVRASERGYATVGDRSAEWHAHGERVTQVGPHRLVRGLVDAGVLTGRLDGLVELGHRARAE